MTNAAALAADIAARIDGLGFERPRVAFVLGSGLGAFASSVDEPHAIGFDELPSMPRSTVPGHAGRFVIGRIDGVTVLCQQGRVHLYEGHDAEVVTRAVRAFAGLGIGSLVLTNAAGGLESSWPVPSLMRVTDHVSMQGATPLRAGEGRAARVYDARIGEALVAAADAAGVALRSGVYVGLRGPSYETPAEIRMLAGLSAQAVGMSTVLEAMAAAAGGMRVGAVSCITNPAAGIAPAPLDHSEVVEAGEEIADDFQRLLRELAPRITG
ncbi:MAG: purine-nucleoside phosphorylase [Planctomycetota bacterium]